MRRLLHWCAGVILMMALTACGDHPPEPTLDAAIWQDFSRRFVEDGRVIDRDNGGISHSEGQGYGMLFAEAAADRAAFDRLWAWTHATLRRDDGLLAWRWEPGHGITDRNNATDGEILIAWALLRAAERWSDEGYRSAARQLIRAVRDRGLVRRGDAVYILPGVDGFNREDGLIINPSYWVFPALEAFAEVDDRALWRAVIATGHTVVRDGTVGPSGLVPDWLILPPAGGYLPAPDFPPRFSWNAVRVPLHLAWAKEPQRGLLAPYTRFWRGDTAPAWVDLVSGEVAPYPAPAGIRAIAAVSAATAAATPMPPLPAVTAADGYFSSSLALLARLAAAARSSWEAS